jgi:type I restriction enzyme M protein
VCEHYGYIFGEDETIKINPVVLSYIVNELQKFSLLDTEFDYKGQAYEEIVGANSRRERGEFFTPRNLCSLAVGIVIAIVGEAKILNKRVLDPACGTGGFLRTYVHELYEILVRREMKKWGDANKAHTTAKDALKSLCDQNVMGIDFNPVLVRAAQMNLVMHGDGSSNVFHENSLLSCGEWSEAASTKVNEGSVDIIITNPPFGEELLVDDTHVLDQFSLSTFMSKSRRGAMAPQELFIERCHRLLRPSGRGERLTWASQYPLRYQRFLMANSAWTQHITPRRCTKLRRCWSSTKRAERKYPMSELIPFEYLTPLR